jgi:hypothetical protein
MRGRRLAALVSLGWLGRKCSRRFDVMCTVIGLLLKALASQVIVPLSQRLAQSGSDGVDPPSNVDDVRPAWITKVLRGSNVVGDGCRCTGVSIRKFDEGKTSFNGRLTLSWDGPGAEAAPASVVLKMTRTDVAGRFLNLALALHREAEFYATVGLEVPSQPLCRPPKCHFTSVSPWSKDFTMLLEDIVAPAKTLCDTASVRAAVRTFSAPMPAVERALAYAADLHAFGFMRKKYLKKDFSWLMNQVCTPTVCTPQLTPPQCTTTVDSLLTVKIRSVLILSSAQLIQ